MYKFLHGYEKDLLFELKYWYYIFNLYDGDKKDHESNQRLLFIGNLGNCSYRGNHD